MGVDRVMDSLRDRDQRAVSEIQSSLLSSFLHKVYKTLSYLPIYDLMCRADRTL